MLKKVINYTDYDGNPRTKTCYFNMNKAEVFEMQLTNNGGLEKYVEKIVEAQDFESLVKIFKDLIFKSYGEKSLDGESFVKSPALSAAFAHTEAYVELYMELASDAKEAARFFNGILPKEMQKEILEA